MWLGNPRTHWVIKQLVQVVGVPEAEVVGHKICCQHLFIVSVEVFDETNGGDVQISRKVVLEGEQVVILKDL